MDFPLVGELEGIGREVEQHPAEGNRVTHPEIGRRFGQYVTVRPFSSAIGSTISRTDSMMSAMENGIGSRSTNRSPPSGKLENVARHGAQTERRRVDEAQLPLLQLGDRAAALLLQ